MSNNICTHCAMIKNNIIVNNNIQYSEKLVIKIDDKNTLCLLMRPLNNQLPVLNSLSKITMLRTSSLLPLNIFLIGTP